MADAERGSSSLTSITCEVCDATPTSPFHFTRLSSYIVARTVHTVSRYLCRDCARAIGRGMQSQTLITGWWGLFAFFHNLGVVGMNALGLRRAEAMPPPSHPGMPFPHVPTLDPGKPVFQRPGGILLSLVVSAVVVANVISSSASDRPSMVNTTNSQTVAGGGYAVGVCVRRSFDGQGIPVACGSQHDGQIVGRAVSAATCAANTEAYIEEASGVWCVDEDA